MKGKEYLVGIATRAQDFCGRELIRASNRPGLKFSVKPSKYVPIPGTIFKWIKEKLGKDFVCK